MSKSEEKNTPQEVTPESFQGYWVRLLVTTALMFVGIVCVINVLIDPFGEYQLIDKPQYRSDTTSAYKVLNQLRTKRYTLVFGTSTAAPFDDQVIGSPVLNLAMSLYGEPERIFSALSALDKRSIANIERIVYNVEYNALHGREVTNKSFDFDSDLHYVWRTIENIGKDKVVASVDFVAKWMSGRADSEFTPQGVYRHLKPRAFRDNFNNQTIEFEASEKALSFLVAIKQFANRNDIEFMVVRPVVSNRFLSTVDLDSLVKHYQSVVGAVGEMYSLIWIDGISNDLGQFRDPIHPSYAASLGQFEHLRANPENYRVTQDNVVEHVTHVARQIGVMLDQTQEAPTTVAHNR